MNLARRRAMLFVVGGSALLTAGCMTKPLRPANADGSYCFRIGKSYRRTLTCTSTPIPSEQIEADAKRFEPTPGKLTVYLVRKRWGDGRNLVRVGRDSVPAVELVPESFARWRLPAGNHRLSVTWPEGSAHLDVTGAAGEVIFVEVIGSAWVWGSDYRLERGDAAESRRRAEPLRLVADVG
ncbi:hypothetical protein [Methylibium petroleiphilum]|uniref:hypothetical protein n=1 Tax=Methylibium petroleiphilum TaxID=105560 RepID=UPI001AC788EE|nr:hypothetical protein [Methylibium petroleiphilum]MBN9206148.1 hypothetical protein [Methylibium petroleiphilum]